MEQLEFKWTSPDNADFRRFYLITEAYYDSIAGGPGKRREFVPYNLSESIQDVLIAYVSGIAAGCAGLKKYNDTDTELKRVWVEPAYRGKHIASAMMDMIEDRASQQGFGRVILQTREQMTAAVSLYLSRGYYRTENYPPYDKLEGAVCFAKDIV